MTFGSKLLIAAFLVMILYLISNVLAWLIWKPIKTYLFKRQNRLLLMNCRDCVHFYQDAKCNCHCDLWTYTGICDPKKRHCYRKTIM